MRFIPKYRVCYKGTFYKAGQEFRIGPKDENEVKQHGRVVDDPAPPEVKRPGRPRRVEHGQSGEAETKIRRA